MNTKNHNAPQQRPRSPDARFDQHGGHRASSHQHGRGHRGGSEPHGREHRALSQQPGRGHRTSSQQRGRGYHGGSHQPPPERHVNWTCALTLCLCTALVMLLTAPPAMAVGSLASIEIVDRHDGRSLPIYTRDGVHWIEGTPRHEYAVRIRNHNGNRLLAVMSVDGVNVITGETAATAQSGYVLDGYGSTEVAGWRKSLGHTAAFYFTALPDAYATRTGRPDNVGVIGVALFRERIDPLAIGRSSGKIAAQAERDAPAPLPETPQSETWTDRAFDRREALRERSAAPQLGTGHGRIESSHAQRANFNRESTVPTELVTIRYDRRENLIAMGILPPPVMARRPDPFPGMRFTPDPPSR